MGDSALMIPMLRRALGAERVVPIQYAGDTFIKRCKKTGHYSVSRNKLMTLFIDNIKNKKYLFPTWDLFQDIAKDFLNVFISYRKPSPFKASKLFFTHNPATPDDAFHSAVYESVARGLINQQFSVEYA